MKLKRRKDNNNRVLKDGEYQRTNGSYEYKWRDKRGKRHSVYAKTLNELRKKESSLLKDSITGINCNEKITIDDLFNKWKTLKRGLKDNTFQNYQYLYELFISESIGKITITNLKKTDIRLFYNHLADKRNLKISTIDNIHTVLHQILSIAVDDKYILTNPADNALKELKQARTNGKKGRRALTLEQQKIFENFLISNNKYKGWYPIFITMLWTGMRVGEITGLRWEDVDFDNNIIHINHTLVYYDTRTEDG